MGIVRSSWSYARAIKAFVAVWLFYFNTQAVAAAPALPRCAGAGENGNQR